MRPIDVLILLVLLFLIISIGALAIKAIRLEHKLKKQLKETEAEMNYYENKMKKREGK